MSEDDLAGQKRRKGPVRFERPSFHTLKIRFYDSRKRALATGDPEDIALWRSDEAAWRAEAKARTARREAGQREEAYEAHLSEKISADALVTKLQAGRDASLRDLRGDPERSKRNEADKLRHVQAVEAEALRTITEAAAKLEAARFRQQARVASIEKHGAVVPLVVRK
jgi:hypothetical protein